MTKPDQVKPLPSKLVNINKESVRHIYIFDLVKFNNAAFMHQYF